MWQRLAAFFGIEAAPFPESPMPLEAQLRDVAPTWRALAEKHGLLQPDVDALVSTWHTDADLGRPIEVTADMSKSRRLGFMGYRATDQSFVDLFTRLREERIIP